MALRTASAGCSSSAFAETEAIDFLQNKHVLVRTCYKSAAPDVTKEEIAKFAGITVERVDIVKRAVKADLDKLEQDKRPCAKCRKTIMYGRYCGQCKKDMVGNMFNAF